MATFTESINAVMEETPVFRTEIQVFEDQTESRRDSYDEPVRRWTWVFTNRTQAELEAVRDFFIARKGRYDSFTWTNPIDTVSYTIRFDMDEFTFRRKAYQIYDFTLNVKEVR